MRKTAARSVLACWLVVLGCALAGCGSAVSSATHAASSLASKITATARTPDATATTTAPPTTTPTTTPPPTTAPPTTPVTTITTTITPSTTPATTPASATPTPSATASASGSTSVLPWVLVGLAAVVLIALIAWIAHALGRRKSARAGWHAQLVDAYAKGAALHDAMVAAEAPGALGSLDAPARWADIQRRADDFSQLLYRLQETAPDDDERVRLASVMAALQAVRSAMETERSSNNAAAAMPGLVRDRLSYFMAALQALREPDVRSA